MTDQITFSTMTLSELDQVLSWAADEGWNPGAGDADAFLAADPQGFFLAKAGSTPIAAISVVNHCDTQAFLGLYICHPDWRGRGVGYGLWSHALDHAGDRTVGLDGVPAQEANYRASGFVRTGATLRHEGRFPARASPAVRAATPSDTPTLIALDTAANGTPRLAFMTAWITRHDDQRATCVLEQDGAVVGFAVWRACQTGTKIGPIIAPDSAAASELIADVAHHRPDGPLIIDLPEANANLRDALTDAGFQMSFSTARMYRGPAPVPGPALQAIATMELG